MSKEIRTKIVETLAKGCVGLRYSYFDQGIADGDALQDKYQILGPFNQAAGNPWSGGICFGLSALYLGCSTPKGRQTWKTSDALMAEFHGALTGGAGTEGMLASIAHAFVRQKKATVMLKADVTNPDVIVCRGCDRQYPLQSEMKECIRCGSKRMERTKLRDLDVEASAKLTKTKPWDIRLKRFADSHAITHAAHLATLERYRVGNELQGTSDPQKHALRDQLLANFSLTPSPAHGAERQNYKSVPLQLEGTGEIFTYKRHLIEREVDGLLDFVGDGKSFSMFGYEKPFVGGHQMAFWCDGSRIRFFDPNFGVVSFSFQSGLKTFLARYIPFLYFWKGVQGNRKSSDFMATKSFDQNQWSWTSMAFDVYRYKA